MAEHSPLLLGLDVGTSGGRAVLFSPVGEPVVQASRAWAPRLPRPGWAELDADTIWAACAGLLREVSGRCPGAEIGGLGITAQLTTLCLDAGGAPAFPVVPWLDQRAKEEAVALEAEAGGEEVVRRAGRRPAAERPAAIARWLERHEPAAWARVATMATLKDYLVARLTGRLVADQPNASYSLLFDVARKRWDEGLCALAHVPAGRLPEVVPSAAVVGAVRDAAARETGLPRGTPVVAGGPDGTLATLGAGLTGPGVGVDVAGTTDVVFACLRQPRLDPSGGLVTNVHACPDRWLLGGPTTTTGGALAWFAENLAGRADYAALIQEAEAVPPGAEGVRCFPALVGERTPVWDPGLRGAFLGLGLGHRRGHLVRAILEGAACVVRRVQRGILAMGGVMEEMRLVGGGGESALWSQIRADVLGLPVRRMPVREASALGAAILAATGAGLFPDVETAAKSMSGGGELVLPQAPSPAAYDAVYADFEGIQRLLQQREQTR